MYSHHNPSACTCMSECFIHISLHWLTMVIKWWQIHNKVPGTVFLRLLGTTEVLSLHPKLGSQQVLLVARLPQSRRKVR